MPAPDCIDTMPYGSPEPRFPSWRQWVAIGMRKAGEDVRASVLLLELWAERHRGRQQLMALCGRMRRDLGLSDADVWAEARKPFWRA